MYLLIYVNKEQGAQIGGHLVAMDRTNAIVTHTNKRKQGHAFSGGDTVQFQNPEGGWSSGHVAFIWSEEESAVIKNGILK